MRVPRDWTRAELATLTCLPRSAVTYLSFDNASLVQSNLGGPRPVVTTGALCMPCPVHHVSGSHPRQLLSYEAHVFAQQRRRARVTRRDAQRALCRVLLIGTLGTPFLVL